MAALIRLATPLPAGADAARVSYSVGRSLTAADFALQGRYIESRLLGMAPAVLGVLNGLGVTSTPASTFPGRFDSPDGTTGLTAFTVSPGSGVGADGRVVRVTAPISVAWKDLIQAASPSAPLADGAYLLLLRTVAFDGLEGPPPDPCQRGSTDPLLDIRQDSFVEVWLSASIGGLPTHRATADLALALNTIVAGLTEASLAAAIGNGVPVALVLVLNGQAILLSQAAGRLAAVPEALAALLLAQVREAFAMALAEPGANVSSATWQEEISPRFRFLPGGGELPVGLLLEPDTITANCPFFPLGMAVYLQAIRASQAAYVLGEGLSLPQIDLRSGTAEAVSLVLAVPDAAWTPDLLDIPRGDPVLAADTHLAYARARAAEVTLREDWIALYGGMSSFSSATAQALGFLMGSDAAAQNLSYLLSLSASKITGGIAAADLAAAADVAGSPASLVPLITGWLTNLANLIASKATPAPPAAIPPTTAAQAGQQLAALGYQIADLPEPPEADPTAASHVPVASDSLLAPLYPSLPLASSFADWSAAITVATPDPALLQPLIDAGIFGADADAATRTAAINALLAVPAMGGPADDDTIPGALLQLATSQLFYAVLARVARAQETTLASHGRLIALQRQHLDMMSTYVSGLAGGVPSDGSGLSFTRIIPFFNLEPAAGTSSPSGGAAPAPSPAPALRTAAVMRSGATLSASSASGAVFSGAVASGAALSSSVTRTTSAAAEAAIAPSASRASSLLGTGSDVARIVATEVGTLQQSPQFAYQPVQYGTAAHITPGSTLNQIAQDGVSALRGVMAKPPFSLTATSSTVYTAPAGTDPETAAYASVVTATQALLGDIQQVENQSIIIESGYTLLRDRVDALQTQISQLTAALATARDVFRAASASAAQRAGDYAAAQQLVQEEVARVAAAAAARGQAIAAASGLFYVRELQTDIARDALPALSLTADAPADLVPGCATDHPGPPAAVQPFLDLLLEVPLANWSALQGAWIGLPDQAGLQRLGALRAARLANWTAPTDFGGGAAASDLTSLAGTARSVFDPVFRAPIKANPSLALAQQAAFAVLSLPDIVTLPASALRTSAEALRARIETAAGCLFETLMALPPSTRFALASLARAGILPALAFAQWPLPATLGTAAAATVRRLAALVNWIARQLPGGASAASQTALGNLVTASVIAAAYGDPEETVTGTVASGGVPRPGVPIRVVLNRPPPIGTVLNLLDANQSVVGTIRVTDHDTAGTTATVVTSFAATAPTSGWSVATPGGRTPWLPS